MDAERIDERVQMLVKLRTWYMSPVDAGSMLFEFEYWKRINK